MKQTGTNFSTNNMPEDFNIICSLTFFNFSQVYCTKEGKDENLIHKCQNIGNPLRKGRVIAFDVVFRVQSEMIGKTVHKINVTVKT